MPCQVRAPSFTLSSSYSTAPPPPFFFFFGFLPRVLLPFTSFSPLAPLFGCVFCFSDLPPTQLQSAVEHGALPAWPPLPTPCPPASTCGVMDSNPSSFAFTREESLKLETAMVQSAQNRAEAISPRDRSPSNPHSNALDVFQVLDSTTGAVLFSYPPPNPSPLDHWAGRYRPEEYAYLAMNTKQSRHCGNDSPGQTTCSTKYTTQHSL